MQFGTGIRGFESFRLEIERTLAKDEARSLELVEQLFCKQQWCSTSMVRKRSRSIVLKLAEEP